MGNSKYLTLWLAPKKSPSNKSLLKTKTKSTFSFLIKSLENSTIHLAASMF